MLTNNPQSICEFAVPIISHVSDTLNYLAVCNIKYRHKGTFNHFLQIAPKYLHKA